MKSVIRMLPGFLLLGLLLIPRLAEAQTGKPAATSATNDQQKNTDVYIALLRRNVRQEKSEIMGSMMALSAQDSAKFWPIYSDYDAALSKLNDQRVADIKEYADNYKDMTDAKADELVQKSLAYQKQR